MFSFGIKDNFMDYGICNLHGIYSIKCGKRIYKKIIKGNCHNSQKAAKI